MALKAMLLNDEKKPQTSGQEAQMFGDTECGQN